MMTQVEALQEALALHQEGYWDAAQQLYEDILAQDPNCLDALNLLGMLHAQQGNFKPAITILLRALQQDDHPLTHNHLAICYLQLQQIEPAHFHIQAALAANPEYAEAYNTWGNLEQQQENFELAKQYYQQALGYQPLYIDALLNLGTIALRENNTAEAQELFEKILSVNPMQPAANFQLGNLAYQQEKLSLALSYYEKIPYHVNALLNIGNIFLTQGNTAGAIAKFKEVLALDPHHLFAHHNLASTYVIEKQYDQAISHYYQILSQDKENYTAHFNLGAIFMQERKWETAAYHLHAALMIRTDDADLHDNYATSLLKLNQVALAQHHYRLALALRPQDPIARYRLAALTGEDAPSSAPAQYIAALFDNYADNFDHELMDGLQYKVPEAIYQTANHYLGENWELMILDLGCGTGLCGRHFMARAKWLIGVDLSANMLALAEKKHIYDQLVQDDMASALTQWQEELDLITAADSFVYVGDLTALLANSYKALAEDGYLIFTIEASYAEDFKLTTTGRYLHHADYIKRLAAQQHFTVVDLKLLKLREQQGLPVNGWLVVLKK